MIPVDQENVWLLDTFAIWPFGDCIIGIEIIEEDNWDLVMYVHLNFLHTRLKYFMNYQFIVSLSDLLKDPPPSDPFRFPPLSRCPS